MLDGLTSIDGEEAACSCPSSMKLVTDEIRPPVLEDYRDIEMDTVWIWKTNII